MLGFAGGIMFEGKPKIQAKKQENNTQNKSEENNGKIILFASFDEQSEGLASLQLPDEKTSLEGRQATHFESRYEDDYTFLDIPMVGDIMGEHRHVALYLAPTGLLILDDGLEMIGQLKSDLEKWQGDFPTPDRVLLLIITRLSAGDGEVLADIEEEIQDLEEKIMKKRPDNSTEQISELRKRLLVLHRYYEGLFEALEDMEENENGLLAKPQLKSLHVQTNRADRFTHAVANLRDYVTQVREGYQNQLDISLNETMKIFTVITAIFLPLTLIAGWYGMNLKMPEYALDAAYPVIIVVSLAVVVGCIIYFKHHRWF